MQCKFCGVENPGDAIFCKSCGKRVDGTVTCPECGKTCEGEASFCIYCGARFEKEEVYVKAEKADKSVIVQGESACAGKERSAARWAIAQKILQIISLSSAIAVAGFALIFVFLLGTSLTASFGGGRVVSTNNYIYYYFRNAFVWFADLASDSYGSSDSDMYYITRLIPLFIGAAISAGALISVCTLSIMAIVYCSLSLAGKGKKSGEKYAIASFGVLLAAAVSLVALENFSTGESIINVSVNLSKVSAAGISLCGVFFAIYLGCCIAIRAKEFTNKDFAVKSSLSLASVALTFVVIGIFAVSAYTFALGGVGGIKMGILGVSRAAGEIAEGYGAGLLLYFGNLVRSNENMAIVTNAYVLVALSVTAYVLLVCMVFVGVAAIVKHVTQVTNKDVKGRLTYGIVFAVLAIAFLTFIAVAASEYFKAAESIAGNSADLKITYPVPIVVTVLSVALLAVSIVQICFEKKFAKPATVPAEEVALEEGCAEAE